MSDPFIRDHAPPVGLPERLAPGLVAVTAPNAGPMTFTGTRSYLLGEAELAVIDPGPDDPGHLAALLAAIGGARVAAILVTHAHRDHSGGARALAAATGAPVLARGAPRAGARARAAALAAGLGGGEGIDAGFRPDRRIGEGNIVAGAGWRLSVLHTPGHLDDHLCFAWAERRALFSGDTVMGWATPVIAPPEGDLAAYLASLRRLAGRGERVYYPGHGPPVADPARLVCHVLEHRARREAEIVAALGTGPASVGRLVAAIYRDVDPRLAPAAARNVLAHLIALEAEGRVEAEGVGGEAVFRLR